MTSTESLGTYLNDHLAGANAGVELARRLEKRVADEPEIATPLAGLADDIEADRDQLLAMIDSLEPSRHPVKEAVSWAAGKVHRLAVSQLPSGDDDLRLLVECEMLALGVEGKRALWEAVIEVALTYPQLVDVHLPRLVERAGQQRDRIEAVRRTAASRAFARPG